MPTWGRAFRGAAAIVLFGILWVIVGVLLALVGLGMIGLSLFSNPLAGSTVSGVSQASGVLGLVFGVILVVAGIALTLLGFLASFLKVVSEMTAEEVARQSMRVPQVLLQPDGPPVVYHQIAPPPPPSY